MHVFSRQNKQNSISDDRLHGKYAIRWQTNVLTSHSANETVL